jgi:hypothetical protein
MSNPPTSTEWPDPNAPNSHSQLTDERRRNRAIRRLLDHAIRIGREIDETKGLNSMPMSEPYTEEVSRDDQPQSTK